MRAEVTREVEEVNNAAHTVMTSQPSTKQRCSRAGQGGEGPQVATMRATEEAVEELLANIAERASWNTANGCPIPNMMSGMSSPTSAKKYRMEAPLLSHSSTEATSLKSGLAAESDSGLAKFQKVQQVESEKKTGGSWCRKEEEKSKTMNQISNTSGEEQIGEDDSEIQKMDQLDDDKEIEADEYSKHNDDDDTSGNSRREGSSGSGIESHARSMASAEAGYFTFDIPKVMPVIWSLALSMLFSHFMDGFNHYAPMLFSKSDSEYCAVQELLREVAQVTYLFDTAKISCLFLLSTTV
jgi:hypothetical protein